MTLKVTKNCRVGPAPDPSGDSVKPLVLPLTFFDLPWVRSHPTEQLLFYKHSNSSRESFYSVILPKLELSLSLLLRHYLPFAGHLTWGSEDSKPHIVVFGHDTVCLTVAESEADFSFISGKGIRPQEELRVLVPDLSSSCDSTSLYSLQITLFPNQGFCIGLAENHVLKDHVGSIMFIKSWAHLCALLEHEVVTLPCLPKELTPVLGRSFINAPPGLESKILHSTSYVLDGKRTLELPPKEYIGTNLVRITLELTSQEVGKLKERARRESTGSQSELQLSTFVVVNAYLWSCLVKARGDNENKPVLFKYAVDFRNRLDPPVPLRYLGNCVYLMCCFGNKATTFLGRDGFINAVEILSNSVKSLASLKIEEVCELYANGMKHVEPGTHVDSVSGSNQGGLYGSDFGWGKPVNHEIVSIDLYPSFTMSERMNEGGGVEVGLCLNKSEMKSFVSLFKFDLETIVSRI